MVLPLTRVEGIPQRSEIVRGMAFFAGTGPSDAVCGKCKNYGYYRQSKSGKAYRTMACLMFKKLTGKFGPRFHKATPSCKYFEQKEIKKAASG